MPWLNEEQMARLDDAVAKSTGQKRKMIQCHVSLGPHSSSFEDYFEELVSATVQALVSEPLTPEQLDDLESAILDAKEVTLDARL